MALAAQSVAQSEVGQFQLGVRKVARLIGVRQEGAIGVDRDHPFPSILAEIGFFKTEEEVVGVLRFQGAHHLDCLAIAGLAAQEKCHGGTRLQAGADAAISGISQHRHPCCF